MIEGPSMHLGQQDEHNQNYSYFGFDEVALIDRILERLEMPEPAILTVQDLLNLTEPAGFPTLDIADVGSEPGAASKLTDWPNGPR